MCQHRRACRLERKLHIVVLLVLVDGAGHQRARRPDGLLFLDYRGAPAFIVLVLLVGCAMNGSARRKMQNARRGLVATQHMHAFRNAHAPARLRIPLRLPALLNMAQWAPTGLSTAVDTNRSNAKGLLLALRPKITTGCR
jgi:hypothetical protein